MNTANFIMSFFKDLMSLTKENKEILRKYFDENASILWYETNEKFTLEEYLQVNSEYPDEWIGEIKRIEEKNDLIIFVGEVKPKDNSFCCYCTSFVKIKDNKILSLEEFWTKVSSPP
ncbi:hypothetical protein, partial [Cetobacterium sp.]